MVSALVEVDQSGQKERTCRHANLTAQADAIAEFIN